MLFHEMNLDRYDASILEMLQRDARRPMKELASASGLSAPTVSARIRLLEETGVLGGYYAEIPPSSLGQRVVELIIKTRPADVESVSTEVANIELIREVHTASGGRIIATAVFRDNADLEKLFDAVGAVPSIIEYEQYMIIATKKKEPWALVTEGAQIGLNCVYCRRPIEGVPYKVRLGGKDHYLCCPICEREYRRKYEELKEAAGRKSGGR
jgi:Lrp/AsnC family leucine-responsive transcriptional regulator